MNKLYSLSPYIQLRASLPTVALWRVEAVIMSMLLAWMAGGGWWSSCTCRQAILTQDEQVGKYVLTVKTPESAVVFAVCSLPLPVVSS